MSDVWQVLLLSLLPGFGNFAGGVFAEVWKSSLRLLNWALHAASGILIAIVSVELIPSALGSLAGWWVALAFGAGGILYILLQGLVDRLQTESSEGQSRTGMWMISRRVLLSASFVPVCSVSALISFVLLRNTAETLQVAALVFVAGLLTLAAVEDMLGEAHESREDTKSSSLAFLAGFVLFTLVSVGLETFVAGTTE